MDHSPTFRHGTNQLSRVGSPMDRLSRDNCRYESETRIRRCTHKYVISNQVYRFLQLIVPEGEIISEAEREKFHTSTPAPLTGLKTKNSTFDPTIVIISCGTNDSSNGKPIGDPSELDKPYQEADRKTLYGAINWAVSIIRKYSPDTEIVLLTPIQRSSHSQNYRCLSMLSCLPEKN